MYNTFILDAPVIWFTKYFWPEGSYKLRSFLPSVRPSVPLLESFIGIGSLVFSETFCGVRYPYGDVRDRTRIF